MPIRPDPSPSDHALRDPRLHSALRDGAQASERAHVTVRPRGRSGARAWDEHPAPALILLPVARCSFGVFAPLVRAPRLPSCVMCVVTIFSRFVLCVPVSCDRVSNRSVLRSIVPLVSLVSCQEGPFSTQNYKPLFFPLVSLLLLWVLSSISTSNLF